MWVENLYNSEIYVCIKSRDIKETKKKHNIEAKQFSILIIWIMGFNINTIFKIIYNEN